MNKERRKFLDLVVINLANAPTDSDDELGPVLEQAIEDIGSARDEEQEYFDNMPEGLQQGMRGENAENAITALESAIDAVESALQSDEPSDSEEVLSYINEAISYIEEAQA